MKTTVNEFGQWLFSFNKRSKICWPIFSPFGLPDLWVDARKASSIAVCWLFNLGSEYKGEGFPCLNTYLSPHQELLRRVKVLNLFYDFFSHAICYTVYHFFWIFQDFLWLFFDPCCRWSFRKGSISAKFFNIASKIAIFVILVIFAFHFSMTTQC